jgi:hypothetical protein
LSAAQRRVSGDSYHRPQRSEQNPDEIKQADAKLDAKSGERTTTFEKRDSGDAERDNTGLRCDSFLRAR